MVKFHISTGVVLVQGGFFPKWRKNLYADLKARVDAMQMDYENISATEQTLPPGSAGDGSPEVNKPGGHRSGTAS